MNDRLTKDIWQTFTSIKAAQHLADNLGDPDGIRALEASPNFIPGNPIDHLVQELDILDALLK